MIENEVPVRAEDSGPSLPSPKSAYPWLLVGMLWFICFFNYADRVAIASVFPLIKQRYHFSSTELGLIGAAFTWVYAIASPFAGHVTDRNPRKWVILGGLYIWSLITGLTGQCRVVWQFVLVRGSEGLGEAFYFPASMAIISDYHTPATRSRAIGLHQTSIFAGTIAGGALAGWMGQRYGWQSPFWVLALAGIVLGFALHTFIREPKRNEAEISERGVGLEPVEPEAISMQQFLHELVRTPTAILLVAAYFGANMVGMVFLTWMPTFLTEKFKLDLTHAGIGSTLFIQLASIGGSLLGGFLADRWVLKWLDGRIRVQALATIAGAPFIFLCGYTRNPGILILAMTCFGLCKGIYDSNLTAAYYDVITPSRRGTATGLMNMIGWIGAGVGALAIGIAVDHHITMSIAISSTALIYVGVAAILCGTAVCTARKDIQAARQLMPGRERPV